MANIKYFADLGQKVLSFNRVDHRKDGSYGFDVESGTWVKATRVVEYKSMPSRHTCDSRCFNATGRNMKCECSCGGKNHGRGEFVCGMSGENEVALALEVVAYLRGEADFNRSWYDGRRKQADDISPEYAARRKEIADHRDEWASAIETIIKTEP